ncbi:MAG TPA: NUDIX domain-containing protein [Ktedonobacteraceae bacterium]|nr:NUDIX domain-containing protein [Ktedonobacteraceae bacterium]
MREGGKYGPEPYVGVSCLVMKGDRFLLVKRANVSKSGYWKVPGGYMKFGEAPEQTAMREVKEETGLTIVDPTFRCITDDVFEDEQKQFITIWMVAQYNGGEPKVNAPDEESAARWFTWDSLPSPLYLPFQHLLEGKTWPSQTTTYDRIGSAINVSDIRVSGSQDIGT